MRWRLCVLLLFLCWGTVLAADADYGGDRVMPLPDPHGRYLVLMSPDSAADPEWRQVADTLRQRYDASLVVVSMTRLSDILPTLRELQPAYVCLVGRPEEVSRRVVVELQRLLRRMDADPYSDALWGVITGYDATDALRLASADGPMTIRSGYSSLGPGLMQHLGAGFASNELQPRDFWAYVKGGIRNLSPSQDPAEMLARAMAETPPQVIHSSGHASADVWEIGYGVNAGRVRHDHGQLYVEDSRGGRYPFRSPEPKVYMALGNCDIGQVTGRDCLVTSWIHSGGVQQMYGYMGRTFYGYMGWGIGEVFGQGATSLPQAFQATNHALAHRLQTEFPAHANVAYQDYDRDSGDYRDRISHDLHGLLWDRDLVAFYGDPAWVARMPRQTLPWHAALRQLESCPGELAYELTFTFDAAFMWGKQPAVLPLPERLEDVVVTHAPWDLQPVVADDFILLPLPGRQVESSETLTVRFTGRVRESRQTSAGAPVIRLDEAD